MQLRSRNDFGLHGYGNYLENILPDSLTVVNEVRQASRGVLVRQLEGFFNAQPPMFDADGNAVLGLYKEAS